MSDFDEPCSDSGYETISSLQGCQDATEKLNLPGSFISFKRSETKSIYPKGCYIWGSHYIYWNNDSTGDFKAYNTRPICKARGKNFVITDFL